MIPVIFTDFRREMIARTLFDLLKIAIAAAFAGKFFLEAPKMIQLFGGMIIVVLTLAAVFTCPPKKPEG